MTSRRAWGRRRWAGGAGRRGSGGSGDQEQGCVERHQDIVDKITKPDTPLARHTLVDNEARDERRGKLAKFYEGWNGARSLADRQV